MFFFKREISLEMCMFYIVVIKEKLLFRKKEIMYINPEG